MNHKKHKKIRSLSPQLCVVEKFSQSLFVSLYIIYSFLFCLSNAPSCNIVNPVVGVIQSAAHNLVYLWSKGQEVCNEIQPQAVILSIFEYCISALCHWLWALTNAVSFWIWWHFEYSRHSRESRRLNGTKWAPHLSGWVRYHNKVDSPVRHAQSSENFKV